MRLIALVSGFVALAATPCLALTISSAPPSRDAAQHLRPTESSGPRLQDTFAGSGRPGSNTSLGGDVYRATTSFGFGAIQTTVRHADGDQRLNSRRETAAPLGLSPRR